MTADMLQKSEEAIETLNQKYMKKYKIDLKEFSKEKYKEARTKYIATYMCDKGFWRGLDYDPVRGEAEWNKKYPKGYDSWLERQCAMATINVLGYQSIANYMNGLNNEIKELKQLLNEMKNL